jgi:P pilus assembly chaperone PapD
VEELDENNFYYTEYYLSIKLFYSPKKLAKTPKNHTNNVVTTNKINIKIITHSV